MASGWAWETASGCVMQIAASQYNPIISYNHHLPLLDGQSEESYEEACEIFTMCKNNIDRYVTPPTMGGNPHPLLVVCVLLKNINYRSFNVRKLLTVFYLWYLS
jgi:hypothetical protein